MARTARPYTLDEAWAKLIARLAWLGDINAETNAHYAVVAAHDVVLVAHDTMCINCHNADMQARCPNRQKLVALRGGQS